MNKQGLISIGIDTGSTNGAIGIIDEALNILLLAKVPTYQTEIKSKRNKSKLNKKTMKYEKSYRKRTWVDFKEIGEVLKPFLSYEVIYTIEKVIVKPGEGEPNSFAFGNSMGIFQGLYPYLNPIEYFEPLAATWKKDLGVTSDKNTSIELAEKIFDIKLKDYVAKGKVDDIAEASLLAFYGLKSYYEKTENIENGREKDDIE